MNPRMLTVEIHDVSPAARAEILTMRAGLAEIGISRPTLLVVPRYQDQAGNSWDLRDHGQMVDWLLREQACGAEIVQHGLTHRAPGPPPPGLKNAFIHRWFSRGCAEFAHLTSEQARERLVAGRAILEDCGLKTAGFVAPAWLQSPGVQSVLITLGYRFTALLDRVLPLSGDRRPIRTPALTFDAFHPLVDYGKRFLMRGFELLANSVALLRVALHPADLHGACPFPYILGRIRVLSRERRLITYREWLE